jgi:hypothetical protein
LGSDSITYNNQTFEYSINYHIHTTNFDYIVCKTGYMSTVDPGLSSPSWSKDDATIYHNENPKHLFRKGRAMSARLFRTSDRAMDGTMYATWPMNSLLCRQVGQLPVPLVISPPSSLEPSDLLYLPASARLPLEFSHALERSGPVFISLVAPLPISLCRMCQLDSPRPAPLHHCWPSAHRFSTHAPSSSIEQRWGSLVRTAWRRAAIHLEPMHHPLSTLDVVIPVPLLSPA